jgi:hypothetical protein
VTSGSNPLSDYLLQESRESDYVVAIDAIQLDSRYSSIDRPRLTVFSPGGQQLAKLDETTSYPDRFKNIIEASLQGSGRVGFVATAQRADGSLYRALFSSIDGSVTSYVDGHIYNSSVGGMFYNFRAVAASATHVAFVANLRQVGDDPYGKDGLFAVSE